jgi:ATP-dependent DNA ligase
MHVTLRPPVQPMLARLARALPQGDFIYEPKWDGFRCLAFRSGAEVDLRSRNDRPLARYFPEVIEAIRSLPERDVVLDGEIVAAGPEGMEFDALLGRLHPSASVVERVRHENPATFVAFDLLASGFRDLRHVPFHDRRAELERVLVKSDAALALTPATEDENVARDWLDRFQGAGIDGVVAKDPRAPYLPGKRAMVKVKKERTAECVVAGFRWLVNAPVPSSLILGMYDGAGVLNHVGIATAFTMARRHQLLEELTPYVVPLEGHPWEQGFVVRPSRAGRLKGAADRWTPDMEHDWVPLRPELVCEVVYTQVDAGRFRHAARFLRWRPDREPGSCLLDQLEVPGSDLRRALSAP